MKKIKIPAYLKYIFVAIFGFIFFGFLQAYPGFLDPDSFYHTKLSLLMARGGIIKDFPWLVYTDLVASYTDHHFLYHIFLLPFIKFIFPLIGSKVASVFINTIFILLFYYFLQKQKIRRSFIFILILLSGAPFIFRISLVKASGFSLIFVMLVLLAMFSRRYWLLGIISFFYVWAYGGWPLGILLAIFYFIASFLSQIILKPGNNGSLLKKTEWKAILATILGSLSGLIINPYFPQNLKFYWIQIVQIAIVNYKTKIGVGAEWYGFNFLELFSYSGLLFLALGIAMLFFFGNMLIRKRIKIDYKTIRDILFFTICAGVFFVLTLKSRRHSEYSFPFLVLLAGFIFNYAWNKEVYLYLKSQFLKIFKLKILYKIFLVYIVLMAILSFGANFWRIKGMLAAGFSYDKYKTAMEVAQEQSMPGDIIFHSDWDDWPMLFYHNTYNRYIVGLDATFMYKYDENLYKKWRDITWGLYEGDPYSVIKNDFNAKLVFIGEYDIEKMDKYFVNDTRYELVYSGEGKVYKIKN